MTAMCSLAKGTGCFLWRRCGSGHSSKHAAKWKTSIWEADILFDSSSATFGEGTVNRSLFAGAGGRIGEYRGFLGQEAPSAWYHHGRPKLTDYTHQKTKKWPVNFKRSNPTDKETGIIPLAVWGYIAENVMVSHLGERGQENMEYTSV